MKRNKKQSIKNSILLLSIGSVSLLGILVIIITLTVVKSALMDKMIDSIKGVAVSTRAAYDQNSGIYMEASNGAIWKGAYSVSGTNSATMLNAIKEQSGIDVTFYYGTRGIVTSMKDTNDVYILGNVNDSVLEKCVANDGYFSKGITINNQVYYAYFVPVYVNNHSKDAIGMIFAGTDKKEMDSAINKLLIIVIGTTIVIMLICSALAILVSKYLVDSLKKSVEQIQSVA